MLLKIALPPLYSKAENGKNVETGRGKQCPLKAHNPKLQHFPHETKNRNELCTFTGSHSVSERHSEKSTFHDSVFCSL